MTLTPYLPAPDKNTGVGVIVCPGGSYFWLDPYCESIKVGRWLQSQGIAAFVLRYRTAGFWAFASYYRLLTRQMTFPGPIQDAQRSIQLLRANADRYGIDPDRLGIMGFSAGGHLAVHAAERQDVDFLANLGIKADQPLGPSFCVSLYPVVTLTDERYVHKRSRRAIMGERYAQEDALCDSLSLERHVRADLPPVFLANCVDDPIVKYQNSELLDAALTSAGAPHTYIQYRTGGHGFGASDSRGSDECRQWKGAFISWLKDNKILDNQ